MPPRRERPRRRAADERDELAPFHCPVPSVLPTESIAHRGTAALRDFGPAKLGHCGDVRRMTALLPKAEVHP